MIDKLFYNGIEISIEKTSREICEQWLETLPEFQRNLKSRAISKFIRDLQSGNWRFNGDTICFDENGNFIDGQHRVWAFVQSGIFPDVIVVRGVDSKSYLTKDVGTPRTYSDTFKSEGIASYTTISSVAKMWLSYANGRNMGNHRFTNDEMLQSYQDHEESINWAIQNWNSLEGLISKVRKTFFASLAFERIGQDKTEAFFNAVETGIGSPPAIALRKVFVRESNKSRGKYAQHEIVALGIKALKAHAENRPTTLLKWAFDESFPTLEQL
jgi:hypothetical protein